MHPAECADTSCDPSLCTALVWYATWWWEWGPSVGEERTSCLLHGAGFWVGSAPPWPDPPSTYASLEQYIPFYGIPSHLHATEISIPWDSATNQEASQLPLGAQPYGAEVSFLFWESLLFTELLALGKHIDSHCLPPAFTYPVLVPLAKCLQCVWICWASFLSVLHEGYSYNFAPPNFLSKNL